MFPVKKWIVKLGNIGYVSDLIVVKVAYHSDLIYTHGIDEEIAKVIRTYSPNDEKEIKRVSKLLKGTLIEV